MAGSSFEAHLHLDLGDLACPSLASQELEVVKEQSD
jgi:hypothetical protein